MNAAIKLICVAAAITGCATQPMSNDVYSAAQTSTVLIRTSTGLGTGVVINDKCVLTVAHVADEDTVEFLDWKQRVTTVTRTTHDEEKDIAVVCGNASLDLPPVSLRSTMPQRYAEVFTIGNPLKNVNVLTTGRYQLNGIITAQTAPGNSGGGVFDSAGSLIGLVDAIAAYDTPMGMAVFPHLVSIISLPDITSVLDVNHISYTTA